MNQALAKKIEKTGLSGNEALVYAALLEIGGGAYPSKIALATKLKRTTVYEILLRLTVYGLINEVNKDGKLYYQLTKPEKLHLLTQTRLRTAERNHADASHLVSEISQLFSILPSKPSVKFFDGIEGVHTIYKDHMGCKEPYEMIGYANTDLVARLLSPRFLRWYALQKITNKITTRCLVGGHAVATIVPRAYRGITSRFQPQLQSVSQSDPKLGIMTIYGTNKVSFVNADKEKLSGMIIEDPSIHALLRTCVTQAWTTVV
ncbi:MAG: hypothetical protein A2542_02690 [Parcubacteria group bacterium RIFOXYD2_FULL_52_8]|nr:MAG: hypothetical protein A2542_02690 [Parcubacteria group bacterium RIFOXYD2_FULL_52_8]